MTDIVKWPDWAKPIPTPLISPNQGPIGTRVTLNLSPIPEIKFAGVIAAKVETKPFIVEVPEGAVTGPVTADDFDLGLFTVTE